MDQILILNPKYFFINDIDRVSLRSLRTSHNAMEDLWPSFVHPIQAYILSLFYNGNTIAKVSQQLKNEFGIDATKMAKVLSSYVENSSYIKTEFLGQAVILPERVLIPERKDLAKETISRSSVNLDEYDLSNISLVSDRLHRAPRSLLFMLTNKCKTKCKYCYADTNKRHKALTYEEIESIITDAKKSGIDYIDLIGGEVFCHPYWCQIVSKLVELDMTPSYLSTKVALRKDEIQDLIATGYTNVVQLSIDSIDDVDLYNILGVQGYAKKLKQTAIELSEAGVRLQINTILTKHSSPHKLFELFTFIGTLQNILHWEIRIPELSIYSGDKFAEIRATREELEKCLDYVRTNIVPSSQFDIYISRNALDTSYQTHKADGVFPTGSCGILYDRLFVLPDGKVSVCEQLYWHPQFIIGDLRHNSIEEIWNSEKAKKLLSNIQFSYPPNAQCSRCQTSDSCHQQNRKCWVKVIKAYGEDNWYYPDPHCEMAPEHNKLLVY